MIDNAFLESLDIGTNDAWIMERVGIKTRRTVLPLDYIRETKNKDIRASFEAALYSNAQTGKRAAERALEMAGVRADQIGMVIVGGCSPDYSTPAEACTIAGSLDIEAPSVDLNSACSSFGAHIHFLSLMQPEQLPDFILLVLPENNTRTINYSDRSTAVLWGDGTFAAVVSTRVPGKAFIDSTSLESNPSQWQKVVIPRIGHFQQEGNAVQLFAIKQSVKSYKALQERFPENTNMFLVLHQANLMMLKSVQTRCGILDDRHLFNVDHYGNTGSAGAPIVLSQHWEHFKPGDSVALIVVGAGLTWASMKVQFLRVGPIS
ncbi:MAG TPA: ketoacyl-ACP synthase III [Gammaproteobacteria bacterium]|nr:ketoacyl-ACP synthase III [Gammaproteobacteria bacterium]